MLTPRKKPVSVGVNAGAPVEAGMVVFDAKGIDELSPRE